VLSFGDGIWREQWPFDWPVGTPCLPVQGVVNKWTKDLAFNLNVQARWDMLVGSPESSLSLFVGEDLVHHGCHLSKAEVAKRVCRHDEGCNDCVE